MKAQDVIVRRTAREISGKQGVGVGGGMAELVRRAVSPGTEVFVLDDATAKVPALKVAVVEAAEVSQDGDLCLPAGMRFPDIEAEDWIALTTQTDANGNPKIVRECRGRVFRSRCVTKIITEKGVIEVTEAGLVLREVRPGVATDDVRRETDASLHVADDLRLMEF